MPRSKPSKESVSPPPAPWLLRAQGYLLLLRARALAGREGGTSCLMFVDYAESPVGPYQELLFIPRVLTGLSGESPTISKIYVSSQDSVVGGRRNWGIPKELGQFELHEERRTQHVTLSVGGERALQLAIEPSRLSVPFTTTLLPARLVTLRQQLDGMSYKTTPQAHGMLHTAKLHALSSSGAFFPALAAGDVLFAARLSHVRMTFPRARVVPLAAPEKKP